MRRPGLRFASLALMLACSLPAAAIGQTDDGPARLFPLASRHWERIPAAAQLPWRRLDPQYRDVVRGIVSKPTIYAKGPEEKFICDRNTYQWCLDHPDRTMLAWRRLGARCVDIRKHGADVFGWTDGKGSSVVWRVIYRDPEVRIWYASGKVRPGFLLPTIPVECVVVLRHGVLREYKEASLLQHQAEVFVQTSSRAAAIAARLLGPSLPRLAQDATGQMQMFFAAMAWYCHRNPERAKELLEPAREGETAGQPSYSPLQLIPSSR